MFACLTGCHGGDPFNLTKCTLKVACWKTEKKDSLSRCTLSLCLSLCDVYYPTYSSYGQKVSRCYAENFLFLFQAHELCICACVCVHTCAYVLACVHVCACVLACACIAGLGGTFSPPLPTGAMETIPGTLLIKIKHVSRYDDRDFFLSLFLSHARVLCTCVCVCECLHESALEGGGRRKRVFADPNCKETFNGQCSFGVRVR